MKYVLLAILLAVILVGCKREEPQTIYTFHDLYNSSPDYLGPWRSREPVAFSRDGVTSTFSVTTILAMPEVRDRPYPLIVMPWVKTGNEITERATCVIVGQNDSLSLEMNAKTKLLYIVGMGFRLTVPLDSIRTRQIAANVPEFRSSFTPAACSGVRPCLRSIEFSSAKGLVHLEVANTATGTFTLQQP